jgi:tetratricopeptide (TPR) repeat protein
VTFLVETYGFEQFRAFLTSNASSNGYRTALEQTYGVSSNELEAQWHTWLPSYLDGTSLDNPVVSYDLDYPRRLLDAGRYAEAQTELERAMEWLQTTSQEDLVAEAEDLLAMSRDGQQADQLAMEARAALEAGEYERADRMISQARDAYAALGDTRQKQVLEVYAARVERGLRASQQLEKASQMAGSLNFIQARSSAESAAAEFALLGDTSRMNDALELRRSVDGIQRLAGLTLVTVGMIGVLMSLWGRWTMRESELW